LSESQSPLKFAVLGGIGRHPFKVVENWSMKLLKGGSIMQRKFLSPFASTVGSMMDAAGDSTNASSLMVATRTGVTVAGMGVTLANAPVAVGVGTGTVHAAHRSHGSHGSHGSHASRTV